MAAISVHPGDPTDPKVRSLLQASHDLMKSLFPLEENHGLSFEKLRAPHVQFFVADMNEKTVGCVALINCVEYGEVKSMYVDLAARGQGVAALLLERLFKAARSQGLSYLRLETGKGLDAAHRLYKRLGFVNRPAFGDYAPDAPYSLYMERAL